MLCLVTVSIVFVATLEAKKDIYFLSKCFNRSASPALMSSAAHFMSIHNQTKRQMYT